MMKAVVLVDEGSAEQAIEIRNVDVPDPARGEVRVKVAYASLNHLDVWIRKGMPSVPKPRIMGADASGIVDAIGKDVSDISVGDRVVLDPGISCGLCQPCNEGDTALCDSFKVLGEHMSGTQAEFVVVPAENVHYAPEHMDTEAAGAFGLVFATAWRMISTRARCAPGEKMLVWGASAGVGVAAIQLAQALGVETIAVSRSDNKLQKLKEIGATHTINMSSPTLLEQVSKITSGRGADIAFDHLGEASWLPSLKALRKGGRLVTCGATTGANPPAAITRIFWKQLSILGSTMASRTDFSEMLDAVNAHRIRPVVDRVYPLEEAAEAHKWLEQGNQVGKVVLSI